MDKQKLKGLWIPAEILLDKNLSDKEKIILSIILYLSKETGSCFASNKYLAIIVNVTSDRISKIVSMLHKKKYIEVKLKYKLESKEVENRQIIPNKSKMILYNQSIGIGKSTYSNSSKEPYPIGENNKDIINNNINKKIYNNGKGTARKIQFEYEQRDYSNYDFSKFYANQVNTLA
ncbi:MAG: helix-turn-helix domain-containing protein [Clostridiales bacterium]|nr:helix-turn-helix domain-containing protein [Clostridiales bacterium]